MLKESCGKLVTTEKYNLSVVKSYLMNMSEAYP